MLATARALPVVLVGLGLLACGPAPPAGQPPTARLKAPSTCDLGTSFVLDAAESSDPEGDIVLYRFVVGDGTAAREQTDPRLEHPCRTAGLIEAAVEVVDSQGLSSWARAVVSVRRP